MRAASVIIADSCFCCCRWRTGTWFSFRRVREVGGDTHTVRCGQKEKHVMERSLEPMTKRDVARPSIARAEYQQDTVLVPVTRAARTSYLRIKRILDVVIAVFLLLLLLPLLG